ncbi:MAG: ATP synthase F1 subunit delta [Thermodesulfobacteriota bacterium]
MKNALLAKRYAKALFAVGTEADSLDAFATTLDGFASLVGDNPELADALSNPLYPADAREAVMAEIVKAAGVEGMMANFLNLVAQKRRADTLGDIAETFQIMVDEANNTCQGVVISASELDETLTGEVQQTLEKITGKRVAITTEVDESIIGGIIAKVGDLVLDGSIKTQLDELKESIKGSN